MVPLDNNNRLHFTVEEAHCARRDFYLSEQGKLALDYARRGWFVFPIALNSKAPLLKGGVYSATTDESRITEWWDSYPDANIGIAPAPSGCFVLDVDNKDGRDGLKSLLSLCPELGDALETNSGIVVDTPNKGKHLYFKAKEGISNSRDKLGAGIEVKTQGTYVVAPGSTLDGRRYELVSDDGDFRPEAAPEAPESLFPKLKAKEDGPPFNGGGTTNPRAAQAALKGELDTLREASKGGRNDALNVFGCKMGHHIAGGGIDEAEVREAVKPIIGEWVAADAKGGENERSAYQGYLRTLESGLAAGKSEPHSLSDSRQFDGDRRVHSKRVEQLMACAVRMTDISDNEEPKWLIDGLLEQGKFSLLYGPSRAGKSFAAIDMAAAVASEKPWFGRATTKGVVAYFALEGASGVKRRLLAYRKHHGGEQDSRDFILIPTSLDLGGSKDDAEVMAEAVRLLAQETGQPVRLILVDTLARSFPGQDENSSADMSMFIQNASLLCERTGAHVMALHHTGKDLTRGPRGHTSLIAAVDTAIEVVRTRKGRHLKVFKQKDGEEGAIMPFALQEITIGNNETGKPIKSCVVVQAGPEHAEEARVITLSHQQQQALMFIKERSSRGTGVSYPDWREYVKSELITATNPSTIKGDIRDLKNSLIDYGLVGHDKATNTLHLTEEGLEAIEVEE